MRQRFTGSGAGSGGARFRAGLRRTGKRIGIALLVLLVLLLAPVTAVEIGCRQPVLGLDATAPYRAIAGAPADSRPEARTWLTYPEWHIVYSAEALGRWLAAGERPSGYPYVGDIRGFWSGYCALSRASRGLPDTFTTRVMIDVIGVSFTLEMLVKAVYENTIGRGFEWAGGWHSRDDRYAARVQQTYGAFMHETPWYRFPFGTALSRLWTVRDSGERHWERRFALSAEYGVKTVYAKLIGSADSATLGPDETRIRMVVRGTSAQVRAADPRLKVLRAAGPGLLLVDAPRYAQFSAIVGRLVRSRVGLVEIAGNDDIFFTALLPAKAGHEWPGSATLLTMPLPDGRVRLGLSTKASDLLGLMRAVTARGGSIEHVYDY